MIQGEINTNYDTLQRDLFTSGVAAQIGMDAFGIWIAIKGHADHTTGECWPGMRRLSQLTGLSLGSVSNGVKTLVEAKLLRVVSEGRGKRSAKYIARERLDIRLGSRVLCTIVLDYVPQRLRKQLKQITEAIQVGETNNEVFAECEIIPGKGFSWDQTSRSLKAAIPTRDIPVPLLEHATAVHQSEIIKKVMAIEKKAKKWRQQAVDN